MAKILLVEDDKSLREIYGVRLMAEGYEIVSAGDGEEALAMAIKERPDLIVSDVMMPKISGFDMLDILRSTSETKDVKVIMMTALSSDDQRARGESLGADRYLVKSQVGIEDVVRTVHDVLGDSIGAAAAPATPAITPAATPVDAAPSAELAPAAPVPPAPVEPAPVAPAAAPAPDLAALAVDPTPAPAEPVPEAPAAPAAPDLSALAVEPAPAPAPAPAPEAPVAPALEPTPAAPEAFVPPAPVEPAPVAPAPAPAYDAPEPQTPTPQTFEPAPETPAPTPEAPIAPIPPTSETEAPAPSATINELPANPSPMPQPTAPFSSPAPASLGERVIEPLTAQSQAEANNPADIASQMAQALNDPSIQTPGQGTPPVPPVQ